MPLAQIYPHSLFAHMAPVHSIADTLNKIADHCLNLHCSCFALSLIPTKTLPSLLAFGFLKPHMVRCTLQLGLGSELEPCYSG